MRNNPNRLDSWLVAAVEAHAKWLTGEPFGKRLTLTGYDLSNYDLSGLDLRGADLSYTNLSGAGLRNADLTGADLLGVYARRRPDTTGAKLPPWVLDLTDCKVGYKKVWSEDYTKRVVIELRFPEGAQLVSTFSGRKCRASEAVVVRCVTPWREHMTEFRSMHSGRIVYRVGETVRPVKPLDDSPFNECTSGIHFFTTKEEAENYVY